MAVGRVAVVGSGRRLSSTGKIRHAHSVAAINPRRTRIIAHNSGHLSGPGLQSGSPSRGSWAGLAVPYGDFLSSWYDCTSGRY